MYDVLFELCLLSESLQKRDITIVYADKLIRRSIRFLEAMKERKGKKILEAENAIKEMKFASVTLTDNNKIVSINHGQFLTSIINNMKQRLFTPTSSHESTKLRPATSDSIPNIISELGILEVDKWPAEINPGFGENEIESLCKRFRLPFSKTITAYRDFLDNGGRHIPPDLKL